MAKYIIANHYPSSKPEIIGNKCKGCGGKRDEHRSTYCTDCIGKATKKRMAKKMK